MNEQARHILLPLDALEAVVLKGILEGVVKTFESRSDLPRDRDNSPYLVIKELHERVRDLCEREVKPDAD